ncbi:MAG: right-handed parallel beta-helix repeat-containing protein [Deltaproteobacteria bacterium]|nr:right-handed parallel beta-helix repeat-containing protein [Deltaproteobacteria bacterium]
MGQRLLNTLLFFVVCLLVAQARANECLVTRSLDNADSGSLRWAINEANEGRCDEDRVDYRNRYGSFFPGVVTFSVVRIDRSIDIQLQSALPDIKGQRNRPVVVIADDDESVRIIGSATSHGLVLIGERSVLDHLTITDFTGPAVTMKGKAGLVHQSRIVSNKGDGVRVEGSENLIVGSEIATNEGNGIAVLSNTTLPCGQRDPNAWLAATKITRSNIHHHTEAGISVQTISSSERVCRDAAGNVDPFSFRTALISETTVFRNQDSIAISAYPFPIASELTVTDEASSDHLVVSGVITRPEASPDQPWNLSTVDLGRLRVEIFEADETGTRVFLGATDAIDSEGRFSLRLPRSTFDEEAESPRIAATVSDLEHQVTSPMGEMQVASTPEPETPEEPTDPQVDEEAVLDTDGDGVNDDEEERIGTYPDRCDSDDDGLSDGVEVGAVGGGNEASDCHGMYPAGTNYRRSTMLDPTNPDSDGDGLMDGSEDRDGNGWLDGDESDPSLLDSDDDGLEDGVEAKGDFDHDGFPDFDVRMVVGEPGCQPPVSVSDVDCDGVPNEVDDDSDNDGCADRDEGGWKDQNHNAIPDVYDPQAKMCSTSAGGGGGFGGGAFSGSEEQSEEGAGTPQPSAADPFFNRALANAGGACALMPDAYAPRMVFLVLILPLVIIVIRRNKSCR